MVGKKIWKLAAVSTRAGIGLNPALLRSIEDRVSRGYGTDQPYPTVIWLTERKTAIR
jgi:hypothetical protein